MKYRKEKSSRASYGGKKNAKVSYERKIWKFGNWTLTYTKTDIHDFAPTWLKNIFKLLVIAIVMFLLGVLLYYAPVD